MIFGKDMTSARRAEIGASHLEFRAAPNIFSFLHFLDHATDFVEKKELLLVCLMIGTNLLSVFLAENTRQCFLLLIG